jgi:hypothetical protein
LLPEWPLWSLPARPRRSCLHAVTACKWKTGNYREKTQKSSRCGSAIQGALTIEFRATPVRKTPDAKAHHASKTSAVLGGLTAPH